MTGLDTAAAGIDPDRVAELLVALHSPGPGRRGSGYRISASAVLTAAHVVRDAARVRVRFNADRPGEWMAEGSVAWSDATVDAAVVAITPRPQDEGQLAPVAFGRVAERDAVLACSAMGFPRFKLRDNPGQPLDDGSPSQYRDSAHAVGTIAVLSNRREGTLEVTVSPPERDPDPERSPWEGMSGAAVWSGGRIIGLVAEHHRSDGLGRLAATRVDRWYEGLPGRRLNEFRALTGLPGRSYDLTGVLPPTAGELLEAGYTAQVRDMAPEVLVGRDQELAELVQFCAGDERYQWWRADAWSGKSALAAWFVLHPPAGVRVVSFFVTGRLAGQADSDAFTEAMVEQLAAVTGEPIAGTATPAGRDRERRRLLDHAASRVGERQGRLLLVVDGLDEDEGAGPGSGKPSIASLLPKRPREAVRVLVFSRPHPGIPNDVPGDHPLRRCVPLPLTPSPFAKDIEVEAKDELMERLHGDRLQVDILGLITAAGGGLMLRELAELTGEPEWTLVGKLGTVFGRSLKTRAPNDPPSADQADRVYLFAHETLRAIAERELAHDLVPYRRRIDAWADAYRARGWPERTPRYLLRPYGRLLATGGDLQRLVDLATDSGRHDRLLASTLGDGAAIAEITTAQQLLLAQPSPDLGALGRLAVHRDRLASRNQTVPVELPALLVRLGQRQRGEALARGMPSPGQPEALAAVAEALADVGSWDRAEKAARGISDARFQARALAAVGKAMIEVDRDRALGLLDDADRVARGVHHDYVRPFVLGAVAEAFADAGLWERAQQTAHAIDPRYAAAGARALRSVVEALADADQWDRAEQTARAVPSLWHKAAALAALGSALVDHDRDRALALLDDAERIARTNFPSGRDSEPLSAIVEAVSEVDRDRAVRLAADVEQIARSIPHPAGRDDALCGVAGALADTGLWDHADRAARSIAAALVRADASRAVAQALAKAGQWDRAEQASRGIPDPRVRAEALIAVGKALIAHDQDRALAVAADAEQTARSIPHPGRVWALQAVARAQAAAGQLELAEQTARSLSHPGLALRAVAEAQAAAGLWELAEQTARAITDADTQTRALAGVAKAMTDARRWDHAERTVRHIVDKDPVALAQALSELAAALAEVDRDQAVALATDAERTARSITDPNGRIEALGAVASTLVVVDQHRALALAAEAEQDVRARIPSADPLAQAQGLSTLAKALAGVDRDRAVALAAEAERGAGVAEDYERDDALAAVAEAQAAVGQWDHAEQTARGITDEGTQTEALGTLAEALVQGGQWGRAEQVARTIAEPEAQVRALAAVAKALIPVDRDRALAVAADAEQVLRSIPDPYDQAKAWVVIAESMTAGSAADRASMDDLLRRRVRHLLAEILAGPRWLDALEPLGTLDPAALSAVNKALHALNTEETSRR